MDLPDKDKIRIITAQASVELIDQDLPLSPEQSTRIAAWMPKTTNGEPTKLKVSTWMCHAGRNNNGLVFREEDLAPAAARIAAPNLLPMDWNHSAVVGSGDLPKAIGVWYAAEARWNPDAKKGQGAMGIWAEGVVWAWAFPDMAAQMIAMQEQKGYVEFSMACLPTQTVVGRDNDGPYEVAIEPVFFTHSALDIPPADPDAKGRVALDREADDDDDMMNDDDMMDDDARPRSKAAALVVPFDQIKWLLVDQSVFTDANPRVEARVAMRAKEEGMDKNDNLEVTTAALEAATEANKVLKAQVEEAQSVNAEQATKIAELETALEAAKASAEEVAIARDALKAELETAASQYAELQAQYETAQTKLAEIEAEQAKVAAEQRWASRFEALPESYRAAFAKRSDDEQARFVAKWTMASDAEWEEFKSDLLVGFGELKLSYLSLSKQESALPSVSATDSDMSAKIAALKV